MSATPSAPPLSRAQLEQMLDGSVEGMLVLDAGGRVLAGNPAAAAMLGVSLERLAQFDALTALPNRALLQDRLNQAMLRAGRARSLVALLHLGLDQFKEINGSLGRAAGNEALRTAAARLGACLRASDTVARIGGDEFAVVLEDVRSPDEVSQVADKLLRAVSEPAQIAGRELYLSTSVGASIHPLDAADAATLQRNAEVALRHAKSEGRNNAQFYSREMSADAETRVDLRARLRGALERREFVLHYQPQVDLRSGEVVGVEALLRWNDREHGLVPPSRFIPLAEDSGLIVPIGEWVLREACAQARRWLDAGHGPLSVAVNLSPRQFRQKNLVRAVGDILAATGLPPAQLELEITEGTVMQRADEAALGLRALDELGVRISLDDFGTGYSSLAYLHRFPVHTLKVDQSFVREIRGERAEGAIVGTVITLARQLGLRALAEGVETEAQLAFLRARGCDAFQGYLFCRPRAAEEIAAILAHHRAQFAAPRPRERRRLRARGAG